MTSQTQLTLFSVLNGASNILMAAQHMDKSTGMELVFEDRYIRLKINYEGQQPQLFPIAGDKDFAESVLQMLEHLKMLAEGMEVQNEVGVANV